MFLTLYRLLIDPYPAPDHEVTILDLSVMLDGEHIGDNLPDNLATMYPNLEYMDITDTGTTYLPDLPPGLRVLRCSHNTITQLPELPVDLRLLDAGHNALIDVPMFPPEMRYINLEHNLLRHLPALPESAVRVEISGNPIQGSLSVPASVEYINISGHQLSRISFEGPAMPEVAIRRGYSDDASDTDTDTDLESDPWNDGYVLACEFNTALSRRRVIYAMKSTSVHVSFHAAMESMRNAWIK